MATAPRYSKFKKIAYKQWDYTCQECGWTTSWLEQIRRHVREWSREGQLIPHYIEAGTLQIRRKNG